MGLIIHSSSCCDVCLEPLTYDAPKPPHAIPCGHIFCRACLYTMHPSLCPLCRKAFIPDRAKKLITGEGENDDTRKGLELLQKLVVMWDRDVQEEPLVALTMEVQGWLDGGHTCEPLTKAQEALRAYHVLKTEKHDNQRIIRRLKKEVQQRELAHIYEKDNAHAVEESLNAQMEELQMKVVQYEAEIEKLRSEIAAFKLTKNPLPPPPEPFPLDQLPPPGYASSHFSRYDSSSSHQPLYTHPSDHPIGQGYLAQDGAEHPPVHFDRDEPLAEPRDRDRKGKGKAPEFKRPPYDIYAPSTGLPRKDPNTDTGAKTDVNGLKNAIVPGASPGQRFMPRSVFEDTNTPYSPLTPWAPAGLGLQLGDGSAAIDPFALAAEYITEYTNGYGDGYRAVQRPSTTGIAESSHSGPRSARGENVPRESVRSPLLDGPPEPRRLPRTRWADEPPLRPSQIFNGPQHTVPPLSAPIQSGFNTLQGPITVGMSGHPTAPPPPESLPHNPINPTHRPTQISYPHNDVHATAPPFSAVPPPVSAPITTPAPGTTRPRTHRRRTVQPDGDMTDHGIPSHTSGLRRRSAVSVTRPTEAPAPTATAPAPTDVDRMSIANSLSSWGTVNTGNPASPSTQPIRDSARFISSNDIGSVRDLRLRSFEDVEGPRRSVISDVATLSSLVDGISFLPQEPPQRQQNLGRDHDSTAIPRNSTVPPSESAPVLPPPMPTTERPRDRRLVSYPVILSQTTPVYGQYPSGADVSSSQPPGSSATSLQRSARNNRQRNSSRQVSPPAPIRGPGIAGNSALWADVGYITETPPGNALGLSDLTHSPEITAPTPRVSSRSFLRSFSNDNF